MGNNIDKINSGATTAFIDATNKSSAAYKPEFIEEYRTKYYAIKKQRKIAAENNPIVSLEQYKLSPNGMQVDFINNLRSLVEQGENKALLISATG